MSKKVKEKSGKHITKEIIEEISKIPTLDEKKEFLLNYIGEVDTSKKSVSNEKIEHLLQVRKWIKEIKSVQRFEIMLWNMLLSGESLARIK